MFLTLSQHGVICCRVTVYNAGLSDDVHLLQWSVPVSRPALPVVLVVRRPRHLFSVNALQDALAQSKLCQPDCWTDYSVDELASLYDSEVTSVLDELIPLSSVVVPQILGLTTSVAKPSVTSGVSSGWLAVAAHLKPPRHGPPNDVNTAPFVNGNEMLNSV